MRSFGLVFGLALLLPACNSDDARDETLGGGAGTPIGPCAPGELELDDGTCLPAGVQPDGCAAGEGHVDGVGCLPAGVPASGCAVGELSSNGRCVPAGVRSCGALFDSDGDGGCEPILPAAPCALGDVAYLGETSCHGVAPCGAGTWGDIAIEANTMHVDGASSGPQDGSAQNPYRTIQAAIDAAAPGAMVAVASGVYDEDVLIAGKALRLVGKCPAEVEIAGTQVALAIAAGADGSEVRALAVTSAALGVSLRGAAATLENIWVHDTGGWGVEAFDAPPATALTLRRSLVERTEEQGVYVSGAAAIIDQVVIDDTSPIPLHGWALTVLEDEVTFAPASAQVSNLVVRRAAEAGVLVHAATVAFDGLFISDTQRNLQNRHGRAMALQSVAGSPPSDVSITHALIERGFDAGIILARSQLSLENVVIRDVESNDMGEKGVGIATQHDPADMVAASLQARHVLIDGVRDHGMLLGGDVLLEGVLIRNTRPRASDQWLGRALGMHTSSSGVPGSAMIVGSAFLDNQELGMLVDGATLELDDSLISGVSSQAVDGQFGFGIGIQDEVVSGARADVTVRASIIERAQTIGAFVAGADARFERVLVRDTEASVDGINGRGINVQDNDQTGADSSFEASGSVVENHSEVGVMCGGATLALDGVLVRGIVPPPGGTFGRALNMQTNLLTGKRCTATLRWSVLDGAHETNVFLVGSEASLHGVVVRHTVADKNGYFGDGIVAYGDLGPTMLTIDGASVTDNARAGVSCFGAQVLLGASAVACNDIDLAGETYNDTPAAYDDLGGNRCGCDDGAVCKVLSAGLDVPSPLPTIE